MQNMTSEIFDIPAIIEEYKNIPYIISDEISLTYKQFSDLVKQGTVVLQKNGIQEGDFVALCGVANITYLISIFAIIHVGAIVAPVNPKFPENQIIELLAQIGCTKIICDTPLSQRVENSGIACLNWIRLKQKNNGIPATQALKAIPLNRDATVIFTSGSSGNYKPALHTIGNHYYSAIGSNENLLVSPGDHWLLSLPLFHVGGLAIIFRTFIAGGSVIVTKREMPIGKIIKKFDITHISMVATQLHRLFLSKITEKELTTLKALLLGGSKIPSRLIEQAQKYSIPVYTTYGSTEMSSQITTTEPGDLVGQLRTSGKPLKYNEIKIDLDGEILVRGKTLFSGYISYNLIRTHRDGEGWFRTGDIGVMDEKENLTVIGRKDNMFISGGENIYPEEIEQVLNNIDGIAESIVVAVEEKEYGSIPVAFLRTDKNRVADEEELKENMVRYLPRYKIPKKFYNWPDIEEGKLKPDRDYLKKFAQNLFAGDK